MSDQPQVHPVSPAILERPKRVALMPYWPGAKEAIGLALYGARRNTAWEMDCRDRSVLFISIEQKLPRGLSGEDEERLEQALRAPPYLVVIVEDHGAGIRLVDGMPRRVLPNETERCLQEIEQLLGKCPAVIGSGMNEYDTKRLYLWGGV